MTRYSDHVERGVPTSLLDDPMVRKYVYPLSLAFAKAMMPRGIRKPEWFAKQDDWLDPMEKLLLEAPGSIADDSDEWWAEVFEYLAHHNPLASERDKKTWWIDRPQKLWDNWGLLKHKAWNAPTGDPWGDLWTRRLHRKHPTLGAVQRELSPVQGEPLYREITGADPERRL